MRQELMRGITWAVSLLSGPQKPITRQTPASLTRAELPGDSPFSLCPVSKLSDLLSIHSITLSKQPVHIDDDFFITIDGTFREAFGPNATIAVTANCGSHCAEYGVPPGDDNRRGETYTDDLCELSFVDQRPGEKSNSSCPATKGRALITSWGYIMPMFFSVPGWYNFTIDTKTADGERIYCVTTEVCLRWEDERKNRGYPPGPWTNCTWPR